MAKSYRPGDVKVHAMSLWSMDKSRSVTNMSGLIKNIKIYESIMDPMMTAVFTIADGVGLAESFPIIGEEYIELDIETPGMDEIFTYRFDIIEVRDKVQMTEDHSVAYNLYCISTEFRKNRKVLHSVINEATPIEVIKSIVTKDLATDKDFSSGEGTYAKVDLDLTRLHPLAAIDKIRLLTRNVAEQSSAFCFFETKRGFNFYSVEQLFKTGKTSVGDKVFFFDAATGHSIYENDFRNIIGMSRMSDSSTMRGVLGGQLNAKMKTFDIITGDVADRQYKDADSGAGFIYADDDDAPLRSSSGQVEDGEDPSVFLMNFADSTKSDANIQEMILERSSYVNKLIQQIYKIEIYGDLAVSAGDVIEVNIPSSSGLTQPTNVTDPLYSGNFLVARLVNNISFMGPKPAHSLTCELIKGNLKS